MVTKEQLTPEFIRAFRDRHRMTQQALAKKLGVSRITVTRWEGTGTSDADPFRVEKLRQLIHRWETRKGERWD